MVLPFPTLVLFAVPLALHLFSFVFSFLGPPRKAREKRRVSSSSPCALPHNFSALCKGRKPTKTPSRSAAPLPTARILPSIASPAAPCTTRPLPSCSSYFPHRALLVYRGSWKHCRLRNSRPQLARNTERQKRPMSPCSS